MADVCLSPTLGSMHNPFLSPWVHVGPFMAPSSSPLRAGGMLSRACLCLSLLYQSPKSENNIFVLDRL